MKCCILARIWLAAIIVLGASWAARADEAAAPAKAPPDTKPLVAKSSYRPLAPGVMISIDPLPSMPSVKDTVSRHDVVELLAADRSFDWARDVAFRHDVWVLKFQFKPMRMIWVDVPQASGKMQRKLIWYMVYSVTNAGKIMHPVPVDVEEPEGAADTGAKKQLFEIKEEDRPVRFIPEFLLEGFQRMKEDTGFTKVYADRIIPVALDPIRLREDPKRRFLTSVEICREIAVDQTLWGVATWSDIDPRIVRFSVYISGLTNAYKWTDEPRAYKRKDKIGVGRTLYRKTLKLNFWRPSDRFYEHEEEIRFGVPDGVDYEWVYR